MHASLEHLGPNEAHVRRRRRENIHFESKPSLSIATPPFFESTWVCEN